MNTFKTYILLAGLTALFGVAGYALGGQNGMVIALIIAVLMNSFAYWNADKVVLAMYKAKKMDDGMIADIVADLAERAQLPMPKVYLIENEQPNAFATGRDPRHAAVAVTKGLLTLLDENELRGVLAHELTHIKSRDTLTMTVTATLAGALSTLANFAMFFGTGGRDRQSGPIATLFLIIFAPLAAMLVQMAISRTREYAADKGGAEISGQPNALASALAKLENNARKTPNWFAEQNPGTAHMFIVNHLHMRPMDNLFSTHPNTQNRIRALHDFAAKQSDHMHNIRHNHAA